jgi:hypothetical protein
VEEEFKVQPQDQERQAWGKRVVRGRDGHLDGLYD